MFAVMNRVIEIGLRATAYLQWLGPLLARLFVGCLFLLSGWNKVHKLAWFGSMFAGWGIPYPATMAAVTANTELIGGALILIGLCHQPAGDGGRSGDAAGVRRRGHP